MSVSFSTISNAWNNLSRIQQIGVGAGGVALVALVAYALKPKGSGKSTPPKNVKSIPEDERSDSESKTDEAGRSSLEDSSGKGVDNRSKKSHSSDESQGSHGAGDGGGGGGLNTVVEEHKKSLSESVTGTKGSGQKMQEHSIVDRYKASESKKNFVNGLVQEDLVALLMEDSNAVDHVVIDDKTSFNRLCMVIDFSSETNKKFYDAINFVDINNVFGQVETRHFLDILKIRGDEVTSDIILKGCFPSERHIDAGEIAGVHALFLRKCTQKYLKVYRENSEDISKELLQSIVAKHCKFEEQGCALDDHLLCVKHFPDAYVAVYTGQKKGRANILQSILKNIDGKQYEAAFRKKLADVGVEVPEKNRFARFRTAVIQNSPKKVKGFMRTLLHNG